MATAAVAMPGATNRIQRQLSGNAGCWRATTAAPHTGHAQRKAGDPVLAGNS